MESSSEDNFAWTDASSDSNNSSDMAVIKDKDKNTSEGESESGSNYKKKIQKELFSSDSNDAHKEVSHKNRKRKLEYELSHEKSIDNPKKKRIKSEPESEADIPKKKKKSQHALLNGNESHDSVSCDDESYLNLRVKQEHKFVTPSPVKSKSKLVGADQIHSEFVNEYEPSIEDNFESNLNSINDQSEQYSEDPISSCVKKKKKKSKKKKISLEENSSDVKDIIEDKFSAEETVLESRLDSELSPNKNRLTSKCQKPISNTITEFNNVNGSCDPDEYNFTQNNENCTDESNMNSNDAHHNKLKQRTPKISDRITFEEDDPDRENNTTKPISDHIYKISNSMKVKHFLNNRQNLKPTPHKIPSDCQLTEDDDIWLLKCPQEVDVNAFKDKNLLLNEKCKVKLYGQTYEGVVGVDENSKITILSSEKHDFIIKNFKVNSIVNLRKRIPKPHFKDDNIMVNNQTNFIPLPETKCRHPLFGSNYKKAIKIPIAVAERLKSHNYEIREKEKKKKHRKYDNCTSQVDEEQSQTTPKEEFAFEAVPEVDNIKKKKKKKRRLSNDDYNHLKKAKRMKHDLESVGAWDSEQAIEENLFTF